MKECVLSWTNVAQCQVIMIIIDTAVTPPGARERRLGRTFDSVWNVAWRGLYRGRHVSTEAGTRTTSCGDQRPVRTRNQCQHNHPATTPRHAQHRHSTAQTTS